MLEPDEPLNLQVDREEGKVQDEDVEIDPKLTAVAEANELYSDEGNQLSPRGEAAEEGDTADERVKKKSQLYLAETLEKAEHDIHLEGSPDEDDGGEVGDDADEPCPRATHESQMAHKPVSIMDEQSGTGMPTAERENTDADVQQMLNNVDEKISRLSDYFKKRNNDQNQIG